MLEPFLIKLLAPRTATFLERGSSGACKIFKNTLFYWTSPVAVSDSFRFPPCNFIKKEIPAKMFSENFATFLRTSFDRALPDDYFLSLSKNLRSFSRHLFCKAPLRNCLFHVQVAVFQPADTLKNCFTGAIQAFYTINQSINQTLYISLSINVYMLKYLQD